MLYLHSIFYQHVSIDNYHPLPVPHVQFNKILLYHYTTLNFCTILYFSTFYPDNYQSSKIEKHNANKYNIQDQFSIL